MSLRLLINKQEIPLPDSTSIAITKALLDIYKPDKRQSEYSKNITIYGSPELNKTLGQIFHFDHTIIGGITQFSPDYTPNLKADAILFSGDIEIVKGFVKLDSIRVVERDYVEYDITIHGVQADLFAKLGETKLNDLDFTELNHVLNETNVENSWATNYYRNGSTTAFDNNGYVYALFHDDVTALNKKLISHLRPSLFAREIVNKIFSLAGYSFTSGSIFNDNAFKKLIVYPGKGSFELSETQMLAREFQATHGSSQTMITGSKFNFGNDSTGGNYDTGNNYNAGTAKYTAPKAGHYLFCLSATYSFNTTHFSADPDPKYVLEIGLKINNKVFQIITITTENTPSIFRECVFDNIKLEEGDEVTFEMVRVREVRLNEVIPNSEFTLSIPSGAELYNETLKTELSYGETVDFTSFFNNDITCKDFLFSIGKEFNLVWMPTGTGNVLDVKPLYSYYGSTVVDLSQKIALDKEIETFPMGELEAATYCFVNEKGDDIASTEYSTIYGESFGSYVFKVNNEIVNKKSEIKSIFVKPQLYTTDDLDIACSDLRTSGGGASNKLYIGYYNGLIASTSTFELFDKYSWLGVGVHKIYYSYPYSGHLDNPKTPTLDICFGLPKEVQLVKGGRQEYTNNHQFNRYWRQYINEITDKDSRVVTAWFNVRPLDYYNMTFDKLYFFEGQYFRLLKIEDYDPSNDGELTKCSFLKLKTYPSFTAATYKLGRGYTTDGFSDKIPDKKKKVFTNGNSGGGHSTGGNSVSIGEGNLSGSRGGGMVVGDANKIVKDKNVVVVGTGNTIDSERVVLIDSHDMEIEQPGVWIQNKKYNIGDAATTGQVMIYDSVTESFNPGFPNSNNSPDVLIDCGNWDEATGDMVLIDCGTWS